LIVFGLWLVSAGFLLSGFLQTAPFFKAVKSGNIERVKELISKKPSLIQARTIAIWEDDTALNLAAMAGNNEMVTLLLKAGADVNAANSAGITPLH
jgi:ankyrin repeat protein